MRPNLKIGPTGWKKWRLPPPLLLLLPSYSVVLGSNSSNTSSQPAVATVKFFLRLLLLLLFLFVLLYSSSAAVRGYKGKGAKKGNRMPLRVCARSSLLFSILLHEHLDSLSRPLLFPGACFSLILPLWRRGTKKGEKYSEMKCRHKRQRERLDLLCEAVRSHCARLLLFASSLSGLFLLFSPPSGQQEKLCDYTTTTYSFLPPRALLRSPSFSWT